MRGVTWPLSSRRHLVSLAAGYGRPGGPGHSRGLLADPGPVARLLLALRGLECGNRQRRSNGGGSQWPTTVVW